MKTGGKRSKREIPGISSNPKQVPLVTLTVRNLILFSITEQFVFI